MLTVTSVQIVQGIFLYENGSGSGSDGRNSPSPPNKRRKMEKKPVLTLTGEQERIVNHKFDLKVPEIVRILAFAGAGKWLMILEQLCAQNLAVPYRQDFNSRQTVRNESSTQFFGRGLQQVKAIR